MPEADREFMKLALALAERGRGFVEPNPLVGAVVVRENQVIGSGWHQRFGEAHAEIHALAAAGAAARGATLYVTLEPCCHHGKTPPCTEAILRAGLARVVAGMTDPFPQVAGKGTATLRAAGVAVEIGQGEAEARRFNAPYLMLLGQGRPYIHAKWAMTLDGKIATRTGASKWISGPAAQQRVHELRGRMDAIVVGIGTALADDPQLTARPSGPRAATRIVLDSRGPLPPSSRLAESANQVPVLVVTGEAADRDNLAELRARGCEVLVLAGEERPPVKTLLAELGRRRWTNLLVEGGAGVLGSFLEARVLDEVHVFIAPRLAGGAEALSPIGGHGAATIAEAAILGHWEVETVETDLLVHGWSGD